MALPTILHQKVVARFDELIVEGKSILDGRETRTVNNDVDGDAEALGFGSMQRTYEVLDADRFHEWQTKWATLLGHVLPAGHARETDINQLARSSADPSILREMLANLRGYKSDYVAGFLDKLSLLVRAEVAGDYMDQAEVLLAEGYHVPAAVLAGSVLEDALRKLCDQNSISTVDAKGKRKTINPMNTDLCKKALYNTAKMQEILAWAGYRNDCAHGEGHKVKSEDVDRMIKGIRAFVGDFLR